VGTAAAEEEDSEEEVILRLPNLQVQTLGAPISARPTQQTAGRGRALGGRTKEGRTFDVAVVLMLGLTIKDRGRPEGQGLLESVLLAVQGQGHPGVSPGVTLENLALAASTHLTSVRRTGGLAVNTGRGGLERWM
jgi:hypothetical protein